MSNNELNKQATTWKGWRWLAGAADHECRVANVEDDGSLHTVTFHGGMDDWHSPDAMSPPNLDDPATQGCALKLISEHNDRKSMSDALSDVHHAMGRGLSFPKAIVFVMEST